jgi:spoIIIJ-associated protein
VEWVEVTGRTVEEAKDAALDQLGVDESEAEFEVLAEPRAGLFGRLRSEARVRARVQPTAVRPKVDRGTRRRGRKDRPGPDDSAPAEGRASTAAAGDAGRSEAGPAPAAPAPSAPVAPAPAAGRRSAAAAGRGPGRGEADVAAPAGNGGGRSSAAPRPARPERRPKSAVERGESVDQAPELEGDAAELGEEFLRGLVAAFGVEGTVARHELDEGETIELAVEGSDVGMLIGPRGQTLAAIQELTRTAVQRKVGDNQPRLVVDVAGYRKDRREALERFTRDIAAQVLASGRERVLEPMPAADRKVVHDTANSIDGVSTTSEGEEPRRRVVLLPDRKGD